MTSINKKIKCSGCNKKLPCKFFINSNIEYNFSLNTKLNKDNVYSVFEILKNHDSTNYCLYCIQDIIISNFINLKDFINKIIND